MAKEMGKVTLATASAANLLNFRKLDDKLKWELVNAEPEADRATWAEVLGLKRPKAEEGTIRSVMVQSDGSLAVIVAPPEGGAFAVTSKDGTTRHKLVAKYGQGGISSEPFKYADGKQYKLSVSAWQVDDKGREHTTK